VRYVALLRGINVGGRTLVKMAELKTCIEGLGFDAVSTYIASGNVLFESDDGDPDRLAETIEAAIEERFELPVKVVVLGDAAVRGNVAFVRRGSDAREIVRELEPDPAVEEVKAVDGAVLWATRRDSLNRSVMRKLIGGAAYKELTVRNLNTTLKLHELLAA
jgi:uncharacterized protein (DUF1697 family)